MLTNQRYNPRPKDPDLRPNSTATESILWSSPQAPSQAYYVRIVATHITTNPNNPNHSTHSTFEMIMSPAEARQLSIRLNNEAMNAASLNAKYQFTPSET